MPIKRARLYDAIALLTVIVVIVLDQWTKTLVVNNLALNSEVPLPLVGHFLVLEHITNNGSAFGMFQQSGLLLAILIAVAIAVVVYLYVRMLNSGPLAYKIVFGMIAGGALGNLLDRALRGGAVVDFISFRIPEINFFFAIFNIADACISVGVVLLFALLLFGVGSKQTPETDKGKETPHAANQTSSMQSGTFHSSEQDG